MKIEDGGGALAVIISVIKFSSDQVFPSGLYRQYLVTVPGRIWEATKRSILTRVRVGGGEIILPGVNEL